MTFGIEPDPARRLRLEWAESLNDHMAAIGKLTNPDGAPMSRKQLQHALAERGIEVSMQGIGCWLRGETSPRPHHQAALASIFAVPARRLFPIEAA